MRVLVAGGGTAGHVFPAVALAEQLARAHGADVWFVGSDRGPEGGIVKRAGFPFTGMRVRPLARELSPRALLGPVAALRSISVCRPLVAEAAVVVGMGGYVSVPAVLAATLARRPIVLHEQNAVPGLANRVLSRWARAVALSFGEAAARLPGRARTVVTGNPVRGEITSVIGRRAELAAEARGTLGLEEGRCTVVVFGGSQGALHIDSATAGAVRLLRGREDLQLLVLTGPAHLAILEAAMPERGKLLVRALPFLERMELAYAVADLVVARAGATSIAEVTTCGLPAILVPYPHATGGHQEANARAVERAGAAVVVPDAVLDPAVLADRIVGLLKDGERRARMAEQATIWSPRNAAAALADVVAGVAA